MDSPCIKQTVCKVLNTFQHGKYLVAYVLKPKSTDRQATFSKWLISLLLQFFPILFNQLKVQKNEIVRMYKNEGFKKS